MRKEQNNRSFGAVCGSRYEHEQPAPHTDQMKRRQTKSFNTFVSEKLVPNTPIGGRHLFRPETAYSKNE